MINLPVLVLNQNYEPLNICRARRAVVLIYQGRAEMLENGSGFVHSANYTFPLPSVVRLAYMIKRPRPERRLTRLEVFNRDRYTCQYCGKQPGLNELTLDHVKPRSQGGESKWNNCVLACVSCNHRKADRTPEQAKMRLRHPAVQPKWNPLYAAHELRNESWSKFVSEAYWTTELKQ